MIKKILIIMIVIVTAISLAQAKQSDRQRLHKTEISSEWKQVASIPSSRPASGNRVFVFDPRTRSWGAYSASGQLIKSGKASGGRGYCPDVRRSCRTPSGNFHVYHKGNAACRSSKYPVGKGGAPMPHCMFFYRGFAIHGSPSVPNHNASHGCIRVQPSAARWLNQNFIEYGTRVIVKPY